MKSFIKRNKLLSLLIILTIIIILLGIYHTSILNKDTKNEIKNNIINYSNNISKDNKVIKREIVSNILNISLIWILGISIIGIIIIIGIYALKVLLTTYEIFFILINYEETSFIFKIYFILPKIIQTILLFLILYYSETYSLILFKQIFQKKEYNLKQITKYYFKKYLILLLILLVISLIEIQIPKIIKIS